MKLKFVRKKSKRIAERKTEMLQKKSFDELPLKQIALGVLLWLLATYLFYGGGIVNHINIAEGLRFPTTIAASVDFECHNLQETRFRRKEAADAVLPVFNLDPAPLARSAAKVEKLFNRLATLAATPTNQASAVRSSLNDLLPGTSMSTMDLITLFPSNHIRTAKTALATSLAHVMTAGILSEDSRRTIFKDVLDARLAIRNETTGMTRVTDLKDTYTIHAAIDVLGTKLAPLTATNRNAEVYTLLASLVTDNLSFNKTATEILRQAAAEAVQPIMQPYLAGSTLVRAGEQATDQTIYLLQQHEQKRRKTQDAVESALQILGNGALLLAGLITTAVIMRIIAPKTASRPAHLLLLVTLSLMTLFCSRLLLYLAEQYASIPPVLLMYLVPHAPAILLAGILLGGSAAICLGLWTSFATAVLFQQSFPVFVLSMLITITATCTARNIHRRSNFFKAGLWICAVTCLFALTSAIINRPAIPVLLGQLAAATGNGMLSTLLVLLLIPVFERLFKITTDITLLELSDMGHPLLQKMAMQAPGTYHHSLMVATLAQNAAEAIGANALLVRVCAYYHDIGKLAKPEFFTENIQQKENPHDDLSPHMSALVIVSHVKEGLTLARRNRLPPPILDAIEQHHGSGLISYFYHKAKTQQQKDTPTGGAGTDTINDGDFRYGGRPPVTPEMAILSLADASEAASRSLEKPTPQKIANMINEVFAHKIRDGQMDFADLTMAQIARIRESFIFSLSNMLHGRIPYPKDNENKSGKPTKASSDPDTETPEAD